MVAINPYSKWWVHVLTDNLVDLNATGEFMVSIHTNSYVPSSAHEDFADVTNEVSGSNYSSGGGAIASTTVTESGGTTTCDGTDVTFSQHASGFNDGRYAVIRHNTGTPATSALLGYIDFITDKGNVTGDLIIQWNASGIFTIAAA